MRRAVFILLAALSACVTPPEPPEVQAAHYGPVPDAPTAEQLGAATVLDNVQWLARPDHEDYVMAWPRDAWDAEVQTTVGLDCLIQTDGTVACAADDDGYPQYNFEQAARNLSTRFRVGATNRDGVATAGHRIKIVVRFIFAN